MKGAQSFSIENCKIFLKKFERETKWMEDILWTEIERLRIIEYASHFFKLIDRFKAIPVKNPRFFFFAYI